MTFLLQEIVTHLMMVLFHPLMQSRISTKGLICKRELLDGCLLKEGLFKESLLEGAGLLNNKVKV